MPPATLGGEQRKNIFISTSNFPPLSFFLYSSMVGQQPFAMTMLGMKYSRRKTKASPVFNGGHSPVWERAEETWSASRTRSVFQRKGWRRTFKGNLILPGGKEGREIPGRWVSDLGSEKNELAGASRPWGEWRWRAKERKETEEVGWAQTTEPRMPCQGVWTLSHGQWGNH